MKYLCNPLIGEYRYQFNQNPQNMDEITINREAADPSVIYFQGRYYLFASMTLGVWVSEDLVNWENHKLPEELPLYGYAPDVCVKGDAIFFTTGSENENGAIYRTTNILEGPYEWFELPFPILDPKLFLDEDGRMYFYWGCSSMTPIYGIELDAETLKPIGEKKELVFADVTRKGYERIGEDHTVIPHTEEEIIEIMRERGIEKEQLSPDQYALFYGILSNAPYIEGAWMNRYRDNYYLQYSFAGTEYNIYGDAVYVSEHPLGPFHPAKNNPYSYSPGGFIPGAGHGSTFQDRHGNYWHAATMRISVNHPFERRIGLWPAGFDEAGELFCNQRYGDWPMLCEPEERTPWKQPDCFLLSYGKEALASSFTEGHEPSMAVDENIQTWWTASGTGSTEWLQIDLKDVYDVNAIQINFADDGICTEVENGKLVNHRYIEEKKQHTRWILEGSADGNNYMVLKDNSQAETDFAHDMVIMEEGNKLRYIRLTICELPYCQAPSISGLRVFGRGSGELPVAPAFSADHTSSCNMMVRIKDTGAVGYNILWGIEAEKLYHSYLVFETEKEIRALVRDMEYYVRVDAFNENGITEGTVKKVSKK